MIKLRSVENIRKFHNFILELQSIPFTDWANSEQLKDSRNYDISLSQTAENLGVIDNNLELMMDKLEDENIAWAVSRAFYWNRKINSIKEIHFKSYLPQGKVQIQRDIIREITGMTNTKKPLAKDVNQEINELLFQGEWDANPRIGTVEIDDKAKELRLHESLEMFSDYLTACEREFYNQMLAAKLGQILHVYNMLIRDVEFSGESKGRKIGYRLIEIGDYIMNYSRLAGVTDTIYYRRARDFLYECDEFWKFLNENEYSRKFLLSIGDVHPLKTSGKK